MKKLNRTYVMGIVFLVFSAWVVFQTTQIPERLVSNEPGPKLFPYISAIGMVVMAVLSMIFDGKKDAKAAEEGALAPYLDKPGFKRLVLILVECVVFVVLMNFIGFWFTAMLGMFAFVWTLKGDKKINIPFAVVLCVVLSSICYFGFTRGFSIPLPSGQLWDMLGINML